MGTIHFSGLALICCLTSAYGQSKDSLTGLPVIPAAETVLAGKSYGFQPAPLPERTFCKSKMKGDFYTIANRNVKDNEVKVSAVVAWYASQLPGFKKVQGYVGDGPQNAGRRSQTAFYNSDATIVIFITGDSGSQGEDTIAYSVAYQRYEPGISEKTISDMTLGKMACS